MMKFRPSLQIVFIILLFITYIGAMLLMITWGIPETAHPYTYHMDEWHQLESVSSLLRHFSSNTAGAAGGTIFHFLLSLGYVGVLTALHVINPRVITSSLTQLETQHTLFIFLRVETLLFGIGTMVVLYNIVKRYTPRQSLIALLLFTLTPIWITLSNYFKYDIALVFWQMVALFYLFRFIDKSTPHNFYRAALFSALALCTKVAAAPLLLILFIACFFFSKKKQKISILVKGIALYSIVVLFFGIPDVLVNAHSRGSFAQFIYENMLLQYIHFDFRQTMQWIGYLIFNQYPVTFGYGLSLLSLFSMGYWLYLFVRSGWNNSKKLYRIPLFIFTSFLIYFASVIVLLSEGRGNRLLVLLPFFVLQSVLALQQVIKQFPQYRKLFFFGIAFVLLMQLYQTIGWWSVKLYSDPRQTASVWIQKNIPKKSTIAVENVPIYQMIPDVTLKEVYFVLAKKTSPRVYNYEIYYKGTPITAEYVILTNSDSINETSSEKPALLRKVMALGYKKIAHFEPQSYGYNVFSDRKSFAISMLIPIPTIDIYQKKSY